MKWERIEFKEPKKTATTLKGKTVNHYVKYRVQAQVVEKAQEKILENGSVRSLKTYQIKYRLSSETCNVDEHWRIGYRDRNLSILSIEQTQDRRFFTAKCIEK